MTGNTLTRQGGPCFGKLKRCINGTGKSQPIKSLPFVVLDDYSQIPQFEWNETSCDAYE